MKILVTGSTGFIGSSLVPYLTSQHHDVYSLVRSKTALSPHEIHWDPDNRILEPSSLEGFDAVIHLAGENLMGFWTQSKKDRILKSRVTSTKFLADTLCQLNHPPEVFICASAIGYYGDRQDEILTEQSTKGSGFLADVCEKWEAATRSASDQGIRTVNARFGFVVSSKGGGLKKMLPIFRCGLGGQLGTGQQYISWISLTDLLGVLAYVVQQQTLAGPLNVVTSHPVTNAEWTKTLGESLHRPTFLSIPTFAISCLFGELGKEMFLTSERVRPKKLEDIQFQFVYPQLKELFRQFENRL